MAKVLINRPAPVQPASMPAPAPTPMQTMQTTREIPAFSFFGIPIGTKTQATPQGTYQVPIAGAAPTPVPAASAPAMSPVSSYGVNNTGRTTPMSPNPSSSNYWTVNGKTASAPQWPAGSGSPSGQAGTAGGQFGGFLDALMSLLGKNQGGPYEAALRERPADIQNLVSTVSQGRAGQNAGGFFGGMFDDDKKG